jgi:hypothetical protein
MAKFHMQIALLLSLAFFSATVSAQQHIRPDGVGGWIVDDAASSNRLYGATAGILAAKQQQAQQQQAQLQQLIQIQQIENQRLQNELLRQKIEPQSTNSQVDYSTTPEFQSWQTANPWFGIDRSKTEFALIYAKQLRQERPNLVARAFFDNVSAKVDEAFGNDRALNMACETNADCLNGKSCRSKKGGGTECR